MYMVVDLLDAYDNG